MSVTLRLTHEIPAVSLQFSDEISNLHYDAKVAHSLELLERRLNHVNLGSQ